MIVNQIHHCSLAVRDLERAAVFYREVLGLQEIAIPPTFAPAGLEVRWFQVGAQQLHLILSSEPNLPGKRHFALQVDNAQAARATLRKQGIEMRETVSIPGTDRFFIADPDGNRIEIIQPDAIKNSESAPRA